MRKTILALPVLLILSVSALWAGEQTGEQTKEQNGPQLTFATDGHDCGTVYFQDVDIKTIEVRFSNTGDAPLVLNGVRSCCGTVVTRWPREPVLPGESETIEVQFRVVNRPHMIRRVISVASNDPDSPRKRFHITGRVEPKNE